MRPRLPVAVVFDGSCPICTREIAHYRRRNGARAMTWVDATTQPDALKSLGLGYEDAMSIFHVRDDKGQWHTGAAAFVLLWSQLRAYRWLAGLIRTLRLTPLLDRFYAAWLRWRSRRHCTDNKCASD